MDCCICYLIETQALFQINLVNFKGWPLKSKTFFLTPSERICRHDSLPKKITIGSVSWEASSFKSDVNCSDLHFARLEAWSLKATPHPLVSYVPDYKSILQAMTTFIYERSFLVYQHIFTWLQRVIFLELLHLFWLILRHCFKQSGKLWRVAFKEQEITF